MKRGILLPALVTVGSLSITVAGFQGRGGRGAARPEGLLQQPQGPWGVAELIQRAAVDFDTVVRQYQTVRHAS